MPPMGQDPAEFVELLDFIERQMEPKRILEIGVWQGGTLGRFAERFPEARVVGIDPTPIGIEADDTLAGCPVVKGLSQDRKVQTRALELLGGERRGVYMAPDVVHVDGDHRLLGAWADVIWSVGMRARVIALHDVSCRQHPDLQPWLVWDCLRAAPPTGYLLHEIRHSLTDYGYGLLYRHT